MPIYEYRCQSCNGKSSVLWRNFSAPDSVECRSCGSPDTKRVISQVAFHKSITTRLADLDPRYDKMLDASAANNPVADPYRYLNNMPSIADGDGTGDKSSDL